MPTQEMVTSPSSSLPKIAGTKMALLTSLPSGHYDDGETNMSALDISSMDIAAGETKKARTQAFTYKAHSHEVEGCAVSYGDKEDLPIRVVR
jgi:hypothetical protein